MVKIYGSTSEKVTAYMKSGKVTIDVVGIGKMGLPLAALFAREGAKVIGVRRNKELVDQINRGICPIEEEPGLDEIIQSTVEAKRLRATTDAEGAARESDVILILVPLLVDDRGNPDLTQIMDACTQAAKGIERGDLVIIETTMPPGTIRKHILPVFAGSGLKPGEDFGVVHAPERLMTGRVIRNMYRYPKIIGGLNPESTEAAAGLYLPFGEIVRVSSLEAAELVKVSEGVYRDVNIAFANTLAMFCERHGVDAWEVIQAANYRTSDYCHIHLPGSGVGGHCIPVYPWFLISKGKEYDVDISLIEEGRRINDGMPQHMKELIDMCLKDRGRSPEDASVAVLGIAFRGDVKETRLSPGLSLARQLEGYGRVVLNDPLFSGDEIRNMGFEPAGFEEALECDCIALVTAHERYKDSLEKLESVAEKVVDGRNLVPSAVYKVGNITRRQG